VSTLEWKDHQGPGGASIPVAEVDGGEAGPTWLFTGGVHGDEYEGPEAIRRAVSRLAKKTFPGKVIAAPVVNAMAYARGVRCTPEDGVNMNRIFPGRADGSISYQWAKWFWDNFVERADRLVDLHAGGATFEFDMVAGFYDDVDAPLAAVFELAMWRMPIVPGVFSREFRKRRGPATGAELGFGGIRSENATQSAASTLVRLASGQVGEVIGPIYGNIDVISGAEGEWNSGVKLTQNVRKGESLGVVTNWRGETVESVVSPCDGRVIAVRRLRSVPANDLVAVIGLVESPR
jgi:predicted deacylase